MITNSFVQNTLLFSSRILLIKLGKWKNIQGYEICSAIELFFRKTYILIYCVKGWNVIFSTLTHSSWGHVAKNQAGPGMGTEKRVLWAATPFCKKEFDAMPVGKCSLWDFIAHKEGWCMPSSSTLFHNEHIELLQIFTLLS